LNIGTVYRLKVGNLPEELQLPDGTSVYPSIELVDRLYPPKGLETRFPVQIVLTKDDLVQAANGKMVTKIIYLEDPRTAMAIRQAEGHQSTIDVGMSADPLDTADQLGRPMAIVRIGSRVPNPADLNGEFQFHAPAPVMMNTKPVSQVAPPRIDPPPRYSQSLKRDDIPTATKLPAAGSPTDISTAQLPPIISGDTLRKESNAIQK